MIWFDCGGPQEYQDFLTEYWDICSHYMIFRTTNIDIISSTIDGGAKLLGANNVQRIYVLEPQKAGQGSITMWRKVPRTSRLHSSDILKPRT